METKKRKDPPSSSGGTLKERPAKKKAPATNSPETVASEADRPAPPPVDWPAQIGASWAAALSKEIAKPYIAQVLSKVEMARGARGGRIFPPQAEIFSAFLRTPLERVKVVIIGQDPYHGPGQAMGLCFSVHRGVPVPKSLVNIYKEAGVSSAHGDLSSWAEQGVFLLNTILTVEESKPNSHSKIGWHQFTDQVVAILNAQERRIVFLLWGKHAQKKCEKVDREKHLVLEAGHPSPLSIKHFRDCDHFNLCNAELRRLGGEEINWTPLPAELPAPKKK